MINENMIIYNQCAEVPAEAQKEIKGGRLKGMTDINPMWRIKKLTETFGTCGFGWYYDILEERLEKAGDEIVSFVKINLFVKMNGEWSKPIPGTGGNKLVTKETQGLHVSDECFKMALTDALSVACKALGMGASVYYQKDRTKYDTNENKKEKEQEKSALTDAQIKRAYTIATSVNKSTDDVKKYIKKKWGKELLKDLTKKEYEELCKALEFVKPKEA